MTPARGDWRWTPQQNAQLYRRRRQGASIKVLAHEFHRSDSVIASRIKQNESLMEREYHYLLQKHIDEEAKLLEKLLEESCSLELHGDERR